MDKLIKNLIDAAGVVVCNQTKDCPNSMAVPNDIVGLCVAMAAIENIKSVVPNLIEEAGALLTFLEENDITDEASDDGDGFVDTWRSGEFAELIERTRARLKDLKEGML